MYSEGRYVELHAESWRKMNRSEAHQLCWQMKGKLKTNHDVPDELTKAVIVEHDGRFQADVEVTVFTRGRFKLFGFLRPNIDPVFVTEYAKGELLPESKFEKLSDEDWRRLILYDRPWNRASSARSVSQNLPTFQTTGTR